VPGRASGFSSRRPTAATAGRRCTRAAAALHSPSPPLPHPRPHPNPTPPTPAGVIKQALQQGSHGTSIDAKIQQRLQVRTARLADKKRKRPQPVQPRPASESDDDDDDEDSEEEEGGGSSEDEMSAEEAEEEEEDAPLPGLNRRLCCLCGQAGGHGCVLLVVFLFSRL